MRSNTALAVRQDDDLLPRPEPASPVPVHADPPLARQPRIAIVYPPTGQQRMSARSAVVWLKRQGYLVLEPSPEDFVCLSLDPKFTKTLPTTKPWLMLDYVSAAIQVSSRQRANNSSLVKRLVASKSLIVPANSPQPNLIVTQEIPDRSIGLVALDQPEFLRAWQRNELGAAIDATYDFLIVAPDKLTLWRLASQLTGAHAMLALAGHPADVDLLRMRASNYAHKEIVTLLPDVIQEGMRADSSEKEIIICKTADQVISALTPPRTIPPWIRRGPNGGPKPVFNKVA